MTPEFRSLLEPPEFRGEGTKLTASGVAMRYGAKSKPINGKFREQFQPGSFAKTITEQDIRSHNEHDGPYLARLANATLRLADTRSELGYEIDLPDTSAGRDAARLLEREDIRGSSIGFRALPKGQTWTVEDGMALRSVTEAKLFRIDLTVAPYYDDSTAELALRSFADDRGLELRSVMEAAERGELPTLIASEEDDEERSEEEQDDGRGAPTVVRPRLASLMY